MTYEIEMWVTDRSGTRIAALEKPQLQTLTWTLNEPTQMSFIMDPFADGADEIHLVSREIQLWMDGVLRFWGPAWSAQGGSSAGVSFVCEDALSLLKKRYIDTASLDFSSIDQFLIGWGLIDYAQDETLQANRNLGITSPGLGTSGVPRSPRFDRDQHQNILDALRELPEMSDGFDYAMTYAVDGTARYWTPYYPSKGSHKTEMAMEWDSEGARLMADFTWTENGDSMATQVYVTGGSSGEIKFEQEHEDTAASAVYDVMQEVVSDGSQRDLGWLLDRAEKEVSERKQPIVGTSVTSVISDELGLDDLVVGDTVPLRIDRGRIQVDDTYRVHSVSYTPDDRVILGLK